MNAVVLISRKSDSTNSTTIPPKLSALLTGGHRHEPPTFRILPLKRTTPPLPSVKADSVSEGFAPFHAPYVLFEHVGCQRPFVQAKLSASEPGK